MLKKEIGCVNGTIDVDGNLNAYKIISSELYIKARAIECDTELYCPGDIIAADISCGELSCNNGYIEEDISAKIVSFNELLRIGGNAKFDSVNTNGQLEVRGNLTVTNFLDLRAKVLVSGIMTVEDYRVNTYKDFYAFYLSIKKRGELLLSSFVISILIIQK